MTTPGAYDGFRQALGAYLLGALSPPERAAADAHLAWCTGCRAELVSLAGLPGLLGSIPAADVARLTWAGTGLDAPDEPTPEMPLQPLLTRATRLRRHLMRRRLAVAAAVSIIAAGGAAAASHTRSAPAAPPAAVLHWAGKLHGHDPASGAAATVRYLPRPWGLQLQVQTRHIPAGTRCALEIETAGGQLVPAGGWTVAGDQAWARYPASTSFPESAVRGFAVTSAGSTLVRLPGP
ncbi:MAG TPA: zf-HC2 domain-containing protein [Streptosporangiaceae bacterium]|nr:zf-HC2 domain-containing protein [Streptosporangiaceae bacterium]